MPDDRLDEMRDIVGRHAALRRQASLLPRVALYRDEAAPQPVSGVYLPMMALILSGSKEIAIGDRRLRYDPATYFLATIELPGSGCARLNRSGDTYLAVSLDLDAERLAALGTGPEPAGDEGEPAFAVGAMTPALSDAWLRMLRLLDTPGDIPALAPLCEAEILYRLLQGPQGAVLRQITRADSRLSRVRKAIGLIGAGFDHVLRVEELAEAVGMSSTSLHRHFKAATAMSPLQFQKSLRLQEARRLISTGREVASAAYAVGYESPSQFSREYARMFGAPPSRDPQARPPTNARAEVDQAA